MLAPDVADSGSTPHDIRLEDRRELLRPFVPNRDDVMNRDEEPPWQKSYAPTCIML